MVARITDNDLKIRHSVLHDVLAVLGYVPNDSSIRTIMEVQRRVSDAVARGDMVIDSEGHYRITRKAHERQVARNRAQTRSQVVG